MSLNEELLLKNILESLNKLKKFLIFLGSIGKGLGGSLEESLDILLQNLKFLLFHLHHILIDPFHGEIRAGLKKSFRQGT